MNERIKAADRLAYLLWTHPALGDEAGRTDAMEDLRAIIAPSGWEPPRTLDEATRRWEAAWAEGSLPKVTGDLH